MQMERTHQFRPSEFRFWVALHELTHRAQFQGVPWLRDYFFGLVTELVEQSAPEPGRFGRVVDELLTRKDAGGTLLDERGLLGLFATPEQKVVIDKVQALMSLLEGHGHVVMDRLGHEHLRSQERMSRVLKNRRQDKRTAAFFRITGLEMKLNQYRMGERFIKAVEAEAGWETVAVAFRGVGSLPTPGRDRISPAMVDTRRLTALATGLSKRLRLPDGKLTVALSGGADSAALAYVVVHAGHPVRAIHVNHGLEFSDRLEDAARQIATSLGLDCEIVRALVSPGASPEGQARSARYRALREPTIGEMVLVAHTRDDQAETVMMNLLRGSGLRGLAGIPWFRPTNVYRPMLDIGRSETRELAALAGLAFLDDPMNEAPELTRNSIRLEVLPRLARFNPQLVTSLARMADTVSSETEYLDRQAGAFGVVHDEGMARVPVGAVTTVDRALASRVLLRMVDRFRDHPGLSSDELDRVWRVVLGDSPREELAGGLVASRSGPMLSVGPAVQAALPEEAITLVPGRHKLSTTVLEVQRLDAVCQVAPLGTSWAIFDASASLVAKDSDRGVVVEADGALAWEPWVKRHPVAWYEPKSTGYLSVIATEEVGWTSSR